MPSGLKFEPGYIFFIKMETIIFFFRSNDHSGTDQIEWEHEGMAHLLYWNVIFLTVALEPHISSTNKDYASTVDK